MSQSSIDTEYDSLLVELDEIRHSMQGINFDQSNYHALMQACEKQLNQSTDQSSNQSVIINSPCIHVTGSNGKGSVVAMLAAALINQPSNRSTQQPINVGTYTSPHISSIRERITISQPNNKSSKLQTINQSIVDKSTFTAAVRSIISVMKQSINPSTNQPIKCSVFEILTLAANRIFNQSVTFPIIEVGIGGQTDATTLSISHESKPLCIIVSLSLEHRAVLGNTLEEIATNKSGIMKAGSHCIIGPSVPYHVVAEMAGKVGATVEQISSQSINHTNNQMINDAIDAENAAIVRRALDYLETDARYFEEVLHGQKLDQSIVDEAIQTRLPCRYEWIQIPSAHQSNNQSISQSEREPFVEFVFDVAHNPAAFERLFTSLNRDISSDRSINAIVGLSNDKNIAGCLAVAMARCNVLYLVQAESPRAASIDQLHQAINDNELAVKYPHCEIRVVQHGSVFETVKLVYADIRDRSINQSSNQHEDPLILVCGSFFLFRSVRQALQLHQYPVDCIDMNEQSLKILNAEPKVE